MASGEATVRVVLTMAPDQEVGAIIARTLIDERLAACVNLLPGARSFYRWKGEIQEDAETLLIIKTAAERCDELAARIKELHPYSLPEVLALQTDGGGDGYLEWVLTETKR